MLLCQKVLYIPAKGQFVDGLFRANLKSCRLTKNPHLSRKNIADRLAFYQKYQTGTPQQKRQVVRFR